MIVQLFGWIECAVSRAPQELGRSAHGRRGKSAWRRVRPDIVVVPPAGDAAAGVAEALEDLLVQKLVAQPTVEALHEAVLLRLARRDVVPFDALLLLPAQDRPTGQLDSKAAAFYAAFGITPLTDRPKTLYLPLATAQHLLSGDL